MSPASEAGASRPDEGLGRRARIRRRRDFLRVQGQGRKIQTRHFVVMWLPAAEPRIGVTVTKRVAGAVGRNRVKRLVREVYRRNRSLFPADADVVLIARRGADALGYADVREEMRRASTQLQGGAQR